ncbi:MAG: hypothetical protein LBE84_00190 [Planctomycetota bacterium]|nr:hypothetical protein [Planctomycetota bacterium]
MTALLKAFQRFWRENAETYHKKDEYLEAVPHLVLQAFLQRVANGGAVVTREMAVGRGRDGAGRGPVAGGAGRDGGGK